MAERSKALDWNSSNILTGVRGFESHSLRQIKHLRCLHITSILLLQRRSFHFVSIFTFCRKTTPFTAIAALNFLALTYG
jgi:hypothetical protein